VHGVAAPLLRGLDRRVGVDLIERSDEGLSVLKIGGEPDPGHLQRKELLTRLGRGGDARESRRTGARVDGTLWDRLAWLPPSNLTDTDQFKKRLLS